MSQEVSVSLSTLAVEINLLHEEAERHANTAVVYAARCGQKLIEAKEKCAHGEWIPWLESDEADFKFTRQHAHKYIRLATAHPELLDSNVMLTLHLPGIDHAISLLSAPDEVKEAVQEKLDAGESVTVKEIEELKRQARDKEDEIRRIKQETNDEISKLIDKCDREERKRKQAEAVTKSTDREQELAKQKAAAEARVERLESELKSAKAQLEGGLGVAELLEPKVVIQEDTESKRKLEEAEKRLEEKTRLHELAVTQAGDFQKEMHKATSKVAFLENKLKDVEDTSVVMAVFARQIQDWKSQLGFVATVAKSKEQTLDIATLHTCQEVADRLYQLIEISQDQASMALV